MTGRTHDLAAVTTLIVYVATQPVATMTLGTVLIAVVANILGAIIPDLDQPTAGFWRTIPAGSIIGRIVCPLLGTHRMISHSLLGMAVFSIGVRLLLSYSRRFLLVNMDVVWWAFVLGYVSHLVMDTITKEGVPWLFPLPIRFGFPPVKFLRITTGTIAETLVVYPTLLLISGLLIYGHYHKFMDFLVHGIMR